jgi:hypothetical protein
MLRRTTLALVLLGCGPSVAIDPVNDGQDDATGGSTSPGPMTSPTTSSTTSTTTGTTVPPDPSTTTDPSTGSASDDGATFISWPETESDTVCLQACECDVIDQDCADGEKCVPWANDGGDLWNANRCVAIEPEGSVPGEPCTVVNSPVSGVDSCDASSLCVNVDPKTLQGVCAPFCELGDDGPWCSDGAECMQSNDGTVAICLPTCDPLAFACADGEGCYLVGEAWYCLRVGAPVQYVDMLPAHCEPGSTAIPLDSQSFCDPESDVCCAQVCDIDQPACAPPYSCISIWETGGNPGLCVD